MHLWMVFLCFTCMVAESTVFADASFSAWTRKSGSYVDGQNPGKSLAATIKIKDSELIQENTYDVQYQGKKIYKGIKLSDLIAKYTHHEKSDMLIMHINNGMIVPLSFDEADSVFIAVKMLQGKKWISKFPRIQKVDSTYYTKHPIPIVFESNKIVKLGESKDFVEKSKTGKTIVKFSPWRHTTSLVGMEFVNRKAYEAQFKISSKEKIRLGQKVFLQRCQFCHGVKKVGADYGWDYAGPLDLSDKRDPKNLHFFVKYPKAQSVQLGLRMPNQINFSTEEASAVWAWMKLINKSSPKPYQFGSKSKKPAKKP